MLMSTENDLGAEARRSVSYALRVVEFLRIIDNDMPIQTAATFLIIAQHEGLSAVEIKERLGMASSTASRNIAALSERHRLGKPGYGLVLQREDPLDRRRKTHHLTPKGRRLLGQLIGAVGL